MLIDSITTTKLGANEMRTIRIHANPTNPHNRSGMALTREYSFLDEDALEFINEMKLLGLIVTEVTPKSVWHPKEAKDHVLKELKA
jgi:hypothetical protein